MICLGKCSRGAASLPESMALAWPRTLVAGSGGEGSPRVASRHQRGARSERHFESGQVCVATGRSSVGPLDGESLFEVRCSMFKAIPLLGGARGGFRLQSSKCKVRRSMLVVGCWLFKAVPLPGGVRGGSRVESSRLDVGGQ